MSTAKAFIARHRIAAYFALTFTISWGGLLAIGGAGETQGTAWQSDPRLPFLFVAMLAGPSLAGLLSIYLASGRAGLRELLSRLLRWRVGAWWYAIALLTAPLVFAAVHLALSFVSPDFVPRLPDVESRWSFLLAALATALVVGLLEEIGWTGFAIPRLRRQYSVFATGLLVGVPWGAWHFLTNNLWIAPGFAGDLSPATFVAVNGVLLLIGQLPAYRILMVWVYDRTESLLVAALMHASLSACSFLVALSATGLAFLTAGFAFAGAWWLIVAAISAGGAFRHSRQPLHRRAA